MSAERSATCSTCGHVTWACTCGVSWRDRAPQVSPQVRDPSRRRRYYDREALDNQLGGTTQERKERWADVTEGTGRVTKRRIEEMIG